MAVDSGSKAIYVTELDPPRIWKLVPVAGTYIDILYAVHIEVIFSLYSKQYSNGPAHCYNRPSYRPAQYYNRHVHYYH